MPRSSHPPQARQWFFLLCALSAALLLLRPAPAMEAGQDTPGDLPAEETEKGMETMEKVLHVEGMMCAHCKAHVEKALLGVNGVTAAEADVENKRAVVQYTGEVSDEALVSAVKEAGYEAKMA